MTVESIYLMSIPEEGLSEISVCQQAIEQLLTDITGIVGDNTYYYELKRQDYAQNKTKYTYTADCDNAYDRQAAADYANEWVSEDEITRNPAYTAYDDYGGNCNNYISQ
jgi:mannitol-specific phosphotransferase system IIBC component